MQYCKECGASMAQGVSFCKECGTPVASTAKSPTTTSTPSSGSAAPTQTAKPMNPKTKKLLIAGIVFLGVLWGGYKIGENLTSKDRKIEKIETALIEKDQEGLADLLVSTDKKLEIKKDSLKGLMEYLDENPDRVQEMIETLKQQSKFYDTVKSNSKESQQYIEDTMNYGLFNLRRNGKTLFYDKYEITIKPVYLEVSTNYQDTVLTVNGKEVAKADQPEFSKTIGPFVPGYYTVEAKLKNDYVTLNSKEEIFVSGEDIQEVSLYLDGEEIYLYSNIDDSSIDGKVLLNGKEIKVNPFSGESFGPVVTDGSLSMQVIANLPWGETKTDKTTIDDNEVEFDLAQDKAFQQSIMDTVVKNAQEWMVASTTGDSKKMTTSTSDQQEEWTEDFLANKENGTFFKGEYLGTTFDLDSFSLDKDEDGQWKANIDVQEHYNSDFYYEGDTPELSLNDADWTYYLVYDENQKKWLIEDTENNWGLGDNVSDYTEANPVLYTSAWAK